MSASNEWTEWHLTPNGWIRGTEQEDFRTVERPPPPDRVLTCTYHDFLSSTFSKPDRYVEEDWRSADAVHVQQLLEKYGPCPKQL
jgi:hypothetical protein